MEYLKVKEWKEKSGLDLFNYDGFTSDYESIVEEGSQYFIDRVKNRFVNAGELICSRKYFESKLRMCTIKTSPKDDYIKMANIIPNFVEHIQDGYIIGEKIFLQKKLKEYKKSSILNKTKNNKLDEEILDSILGLNQSIRTKNISRNKSVEFAQLTKQESEVKLEVEDISQDQRRYLKKYLGMTEEQAYEKLIYDLDKILENRDKARLTDIPLDMLEVYSILSLKRSKLVSKLSKEEMGELYLIPFDADEKDFLKTFKIISTEGQRNAVVFNYTDEENNRVKGIMPVSDEKKEELDKMDNPFKK